MDGHDVDDGIDLAAVVREIEQDARERRRSGEYSIALERELEELFTRFAPPTVSGDLRALIDNAEEHGLIEPFIPVESEKPAGRYVKQGFAKALGWYHTWLTQEISQFAGAAVRALRVGADRIEAVEQRLGDLHTHRRLTETLIVAEPDDVTCHEIAQQLAAVRSRVLVARADSGSIVAALRAVGVDAYGIEPSRARRDEADAAGVDLLADDLGSHLDTVAPGALGAVVLRGTDMDADSIGARIGFVQRALTALAPSGRLVVVGTRPDRASATLRELALAPPLSLASWSTVLAHAGAVVEESFERSDHVVVIARRA